jgi:hypothetical protein
MRRVPENRFTGNPFVAAKWGLIGGESIAGITDPTVPCNA